MIKKIKKIGIIDCDFGNIASLKNSIRYLDHDYKVIHDKIDLDNISHIILPGVGFITKQQKKLKIKD